MKLKKIQKNKAFVLLFAVVISSIILAIALGVANISLKEINFGTSARDANDAFFAADTGAECALYYDRSDNNAFKETTNEGEGSVPLIMTCAGSKISFINKPPPWSFVISGLGSTGQSCAKVTVSKDNTSILTTTTIISKGYNVGDKNCSSSNPNRVERELEVTYSKYE